MIAKTTGYYVGFDVGADTVHVVALDPAGKIVYSPVSLMHFGNPIDALREAYQDLVAKLGEENVAGVAFTGSTGKLVAEKTNNPFYFDSVSIPAGAEVIAPYAEYIFHMGSSNPYFFERIIDKDTGRAFVADDGTGTKCGGGSGILINKQVRRFFGKDCPVKLEDYDAVPDAREKGRIKRENRKRLQQQIEQMHARALDSVYNSLKEIDVGGRCGVIIQSDMIHLQNSGEQIPNILKGMFKRIAKNYQSDVIRTRILDKRKKAIVSGGIFLNTKMVEMLSEQLGMDVHLPEAFEKIGAAGAALRALREKKYSRFNPADLDSVAEAQKQAVQFAPALASALGSVHVYPDEKTVAKTDDGLIIYRELKSPAEVVLGIDGGSTTTKALIAMASNLDVVAEICLDTNGKPLETAQNMFGAIRKHIGDKLLIRGIAYTGSSGAFYYKLFTDFKKSPSVAGADILKDEITCHAMGVKHFNSKVDTIFECGGQDAKFTLFNQDGTVRKAKMNLSCMAGTGQSMKNTLDMLGFDFDSFKDYALAAKRTPVSDETCAVFTEATILKLVALGFPKEEISAAIAFGFMGGYTNKFVGSEKYGEFASAQGGTFLGEACLAALALHSGMEIHAFPHRQLFGAFGAAIAAFNTLENHKKQGIKYECRFRGLDVADMSFEKSVVLCSMIVKNTCGTRDCQLQVYRIGDEVIFSGGLCPKGNTDISIKRVPNYIELYKKMLEKHLSKFARPFDSAPSEKERVLIPRSLSFLNEEGIFYAALYNALGFEVIVSPESDDRIANLGFTYAHSESCYPVKLAHGHAALLKQKLRPGKDKILLVNLLGTDKEKYKFCPYVASAGFSVKNSLQIENEDALLPVLHFDDPNYNLERAVRKDLERVFGKRFRPGVVRQALKSARSAQETFCTDVYSRGQQIVSNLQKKNEKIFVAIGRGYTILDDKASSKVHELFVAYGMHFIPSFFLKLPDFKIDDIAENMYWRQGQTMIKYLIGVVIDPHLYPVRETNFNCGTDSIILYHEEDVAKKAAKPFLVLQTDGHNSNAQFGTRTLANYEVVKNHKPITVKLDDFRKKGPKSEIKKIIGIPYMGDDSYAVAAAFKGYGYNAEVLPTQTQESKYFARKLISTNTCRPFSFVIGDIIAWLHGLKARGIDPNKDVVVFVAKAKGPCRLGQYCIILRKFIDEMGFVGTPIFDLDSNEDYTNVPLPKMAVTKLSSLAYKGILGGDLLFDALLRTRPYEKEQGAAQKVYDRLREELYRLIEERPSIRRLVPFMQKAKQEFEAVLDSSQKRKPIVAMTGEIFIRCHPQSNQESIRLLEKYGLEITLIPVSQWLDYNNKYHIIKFYREKRWTKLLAALLKKRYIKYMLDKLSKPFAEYSKGREYHDPAYLVEAPQRALIYEKSIGGESPLSIGEAYLFAEGDDKNISGIYHVGPFGCMHETVATSIINPIIQKERSKAKEMNSKIIPFMDAVFGDSELPNLEAEVAAFAEKCYLKKEMSKSA
jgi:activator of 2-hydroxyglutaryl-CoA dehydratase/predicted nucleotide-binding protein (sugar kinase/HSP70/actin superfamily)